MLRNEFKRRDGKLAARVNSSGGWLDLERRKLIMPPKELLQTLHSLERTEHFAELIPSVE
jgi:acyl-CoA thioester hydrolase